MKGSDHTDGRTFVTRFTSDTSSYTKGISEMQAKLRSLNKDLKDNQAEQKAASKTIKDAEKEITKLTKEINKHGDEDGKLTKRIEELNRQIANEKDHIDKLKVAQAQIQRQINETNDSINAQKKALDTLAKSYDDAQKYAKELALEVGGLAAAGTAALAALFEFAHGAASWADDLETMSQKTGIANAELQKMQYAADIIDVSAETVSGALNKMTLNMQTAQSSAGKQREAFEELGISYEDAAGKLRDRETVFYELIDALGKIESETERDALAMNIFGRSATELNPLIKGGAQTLKELGAQAEAAGLILSDDAVKGLHDFNDQIDLLKAKGGQISKIIAGQTTPAFEGMLAVADDLLDKINELAQTGELERISRQAGVYITDLAKGLEGLISFCWKYKEAIAAGAAAMVTFKIAMSVGNLINSLVIGFRALSVATKAETADMAALNVVMDANPIGVVLALVGALAGALSVLAITSANARNEFDELNQTLDIAEDSANKTIARAEAGISTINTLAKEYDRLRAQSSLNEAEQRKLASIAEQLRSKLGLQEDQIRTAAGAYQDLSKYIEEASEKMRAQAKLSAAQSVLETAYEEMYRLEREYSKARDEVEELANSQKDIRDGIELTNKAAKRDELHNAYRKAASAVSDYEKKLSDATSEMQSFGEAAAGTGGKINNDLNNSYKSDTKNFTAELYSKFSSQKDVYQKMLEQSKELVDKYKENYGIDLQNFSNAEAARLTIVAQAEEKFRRMRDAYNKYNSGNYQIGMENGNEYLIYRDGNGNARRINKGSDEWNAWKSAEADYIAAMHEASTAGFDFQREIDRTLGGFVSGGGLSNPGSSSSSTASSSQWRVWSDSAEGTGATRAAAHLDWLNKMKALGKITAEQEIAELKDVAKFAENTAEDRYKVALALYNAQQKLESDSAKNTQEKLSLAAEAYKRLVQGQIDKQKEKADAAKEAADKEIAAIDAVMKKRQEDKDDEKRKKELQSIEDQLRYKQLDNLSRYELQKRRQEILTEQADVNYERQMQNRKDSLRADADNVQARADAAIARLNAAADAAAYAYARQSGSLSNSQIVNNNSVQQNFQIIRNAGTDQQLIDLLERELWSG